MRLARARCSSPPRPRTSPRQRGDLWRCTSFPLPSLRPRCSTRRGRLFGGAHAPADPAPPPALVPLRPDAAAAAARLSARPPLPPPSRGDDRVEIEHPGAISAEAAAAPVLACATRRPTPPALGAARSTVGELTCVLAQSCRTRGVARRCQPLAASIVHRLPGRIVCCRACPASHSIG